MSLEKRVPVVLTPTRGFKRELEHLYARRAAIDTLIQSLEAYDRFYRVRSVSDHKRKSA
jgi:hypothetical protein